MLTTLAIENYRSLRHLVMPLTPLTVVTGVNGSGKSNLYRALRLLAETSSGGTVSALAREGGIESTLWAGPEKPTKNTPHVRHGELRLGFSGSDFGYAIDLGLPQPAQSMFNLDPEIKRESVWAGEVLRPSTAFAERYNQNVRLRGESGAWSDDIDRIRNSDSILHSYADPRRAPELILLRERVRSWRFYDHLRTDADAPARASSVGTRTPVLGHDGADLASALQTIEETGDFRAMATAVDNAFPGSRIRIADRSGRFELELRQPGLLRPLGVAELSDGTLRYLLLVAALLSPRPPELLVLNEPETSLHPDLLPALAELISIAAEQTQLIVVSHAMALVRAIEAASAERGQSAGTIELVKDSGQTLVSGQGRLDEPAWYWPTR